MGGAFPPALSLAATGQLSASVIVTLPMLHPWNHTVFDFLRLAAFIWCNTLDISGLRWNLFLCTDEWAPWTGCSAFPCPLSLEGHLGCSAVTSKASVATRVLVLSRMLLSATPRGSPGKRTVAARHLAQALSAVPGVLVCRRCLVPCSVLAPQPPLVPSPCGRLAI